MSDDVVRVSISAYKLCHSPQKIETVGLGSCMGVLIFDRTTGICGMAHVMLPDSKKITSETNRKKFADTCLQDMYDEMLSEGVLSANQLVAKIAGGAKMFSKKMSNEFLNIGAQNYLAVCRKLAALNIPVLAEDVGGTCSRTITFDPVTEELSIRVVETDGIHEYII